MAADVLAGAWRLLAEPWELAFMQRALVGATLIAVLAGILGCFVILKGLVFVGDAVAHASLGGLALAWLAGWSLPAGALAAAFATALGVHGVRRRAAVRDDTALGILFTGAFALGIMILSRARGFAPDLNGFLLGNVLAIGPAELWATAVVAAVSLGLVAAVFHTLTFAVFDPEGAEAAGLPSGALHALLLCVLALVVTVAIQAVGVVLVVALLVTPPATASLFTRRLDAMMALAAGAGTLSALLGLYLSYHFAVASGATIVVVATALFGLALLVRPRRARARPR